MRLVGVLLLVGDVSLVVFVSIFEHTHQYDKDKRNGVCRNTIGNRDALYCLHVGNNQEVKILKFSKLRAQVQGQESENIVFRRAYRVAFETFCVSFLVSAVTLINHNNPTLCFCFLIRNGHA